MLTYHIHLKGIVQGVGFRPLVFRLAKQYGLSGWVNNTTDGVHIEFNASPEQANRFYNQLLSEPPSLAIISEHRLFEVPFRPISGFRIVASKEAATPDLPLTPDFSICNDCREELYQPSYHRRGYSFITCTNCGPRYSIIKRLPYDRSNTTMAPFHQCTVCDQEYHDPNNRRYFSQTNSCPLCGISLFKTNGDSVTPDEIGIWILAGKIVAVKGIGGYLLLVDASNEMAVKRLRQRKQRPSKPFALMYPNLCLLQEHYCISKHESDMLTGPVAPILLLQPRTKYLPIAREAIAPGLGRIGCMLPYAPLFELILRACGIPLVATSGNISGSPVLYENEMAHRELSRLADEIVSHNRCIVVPQDDSVMVLPRQGPTILLRRSRGLAPSLLDPGFELPSVTTLATGAQLKSSFALASRGRLYVSQYLGDMDNYLSQVAYKHTLQHFFHLFNDHPGVIVADLHPGYFSTQMALEMAAEKQVPLIRVQHHEAHCWAVLAENKLINTPDPVMGVIWDGTGYGTDGQIWGGEFFLYSQKGLQRTWHLPYFPFILGDKMVREPRLSILALAADLIEDSKKFSPDEWRLYTKLLNNTTLFASSMGRLFDAVACLLLGISRVSYEGEAALYLQNIAEKHHDIQKIEPYSLPDQDELFYQTLFEQLTKDCESGESASLAAARFHLTLIELIRQEARKQGVKKLAFSGGVWQNSLLIELAIDLLQDEFELYFHRHLSPNDENISYGQLAAYSQQVNKM